MGGRRLTTAALGVLLLSGCGGNPSIPSGSGAGSGSTSGGSGSALLCTVSAPTNGSVTSRVDGAVWMAGSITAASTTSPGPDSFVTFTIGTGGCVSGDPVTRTTGIGFSITKPGVGTFQLANGTASLLLQVTDSGILRGWQASPVDSGSSGVITLTSFGGGRAVGTFSATVVPTVGGATGTRTISNGTFDVRYQ